MKKWILIFIVLVCGLIFWKWFFNQPCTPPDKPKNVPDKAIWKGGCDGGNWVELISIDKQKIRFKIYRDWNGELILDADFVYVECDTFHLTKTNWIKCGGDFINGSIGIKTNCFNNINCRLEPIYPAYFEEKIE
jgi:hypothetical protein